MYKRSTILLGLFGLLFISMLAGCSQSKIFEWVSPAIDGSVSIHISLKYDWNKRTSEENMETAQLAVRESEAVYKKQQSDKEYGSLYEHDFQTTYGYFNDEIVFYYDKNNMPDVTTDRNIIADCIDPDHAINGISDLELFGVSNGVAYFNVAVTPGSKWSSKTLEEKGEIAEKVIRYCTILAERENVLSFEIVCVEDDSYSAFNWKGGDTIQIHSNKGKFEADYQIKTP